MSCPGCSAPLPARGVVCAYCGTRVDVDLQGWSHLRPRGLSDQLRCPDGHGPLETLDLPQASNAEEPVQLGRCPQCLGLFLPVGGVERLMDQAVAPVWSVNLQLLASLADTPRAEDAPLRYRPCPSCGDLMHRSLYGKRSGVVVDRCRDHGLWLDAGELRQLLEWARAGGPLFDQERREQEAREQQDRGQESCAEAEQLQRAELDGGRLDLLNTDLLELLVRLARDLL